MEEIFPVLIASKSLKPEFSNIEKIKITSEDFTIGRGLNNSLVIPFIAISRNHCKFRKNNNDWFIEDYSSFGIQINGNKLGKGNQKMLKDEDVMVFDPSQEFVYKFVYNDSDLTPCSKKRIKLDTDATNDDSINNVKLNLEQEEIRIKEKQVFEELLKKKTELLRLEKEKELSKLAEQKKQRECELMEELNNIKRNLEEQVERIEKQKCDAEKQLNEQLDEMKKNKNEDKCKMEQLLLEREDIQKRLIEAQETSQKHIEELKSRVTEREVELAALAAERIQKQAEQSSEVISSLQEQLEKVRNQLQSVENENKKLLENSELENKEPQPSHSKVAEFGEILESELQCIICSELFVSAMTLNCSHTFCKYCITMWKKKKKDCPICRSTITSECKSLVLDSFIDKMVQNLSDEMKQKRQEMLKTRQELESELVRQFTEKITRRRVSYEIENETSSEFFEEEEEDEEFNFDHDDVFGFDDNGYDYDDTLEFDDNGYEFEESDSNSGSYNY